MATSRSRRTLLAATPGLAAALAWPRWSYGQAGYPGADKSIRIVVPFSPGTGIDILARTLGQKLGDEVEGRGRGREPRRARAATSAPRRRPSRRPTATRC